MTANPEHSTCPKWAAQEARRIALEEAAALCDRMVANRKSAEDANGVRIAWALAHHIRALIKAGK